MRSVRGNRAAAVGALALVCTSGVGLAQVQQSTGPDVIVGELPDTWNVNTETVGGVAYDGFAVGTTSCNQGNMPLNWLTGGTDNRHPAIGQNLFRLNNGRFEQIGQAWLKHGFTALQGSVCTAEFGFPCTANPNGTALGVGCSDPYGASLNASQGGLGPKWQVNASLGLFPYPFAAGTGSGSTFKLIRVRNSDIVSGARYFVEGQYVCGDDAGFNNKNNNASWREVTVGGGTAAEGFNMNLASGSTTHRRQPAIYAWQAVDPSVVISTVDIVNDGRYVLGVKVTNNGGSPVTYTYEYALQNLNSHRSAASFTVPYPSGTSVTGVGFHDVEYHSGEPNQPANAANPGADDWTPGAGATQITWSGPAYSGTPPQYTYTTTGASAYMVTAFTPGTGNDHSANALRWGTLYNFRFTTTVAPANGFVQIGMFRPGTPSSFTMAAPTPGGATVTTSTGPCCTGTTCTVTSQAACTGTFGTIGATCSPDPCATGACCTASTGACSVGTQAACAGTWTAGGMCNPNPCPAPTGACCNGSACTVTTAAGCAFTYAGNGSTCATANCQALPQNDSCSRAIPLCDGVPVAGTTVGATPDGNASCAGTSGSGPSVWYSYTPSGTTGTVLVTIDTCTANYDSAISVWSGACPGTTEVGCDDDACGNLHSRVAVTLNRGQQYLIRVGGYNGATGTFTVTATGGGGTGCQGTGSCCSGSSCSVTTQAQCTGTWTTGGSCSPNPCNPTGACCSGGSCTSSTQSACQGTFTAGGACSPNPCPPLNDDCNNRQGIGPGSTPFDTTNATTDGPTHTGCNFSGSNQIYKDIWFNFPATFNGTIDVDTCGSTWDTKLAVYDGTGCTNLDARLLACSDDAGAAPPAGCGTGSLQSKVTVTVVSGNHYTIRVGAFGATTGAPGVLNITTHPNPTGSCCQANGSCLNTEQGACTGTWTSGAACSPNPCPQPNGACCTGTACALGTQASCGGNFQGSGTACGPAGNPTTCCPANINGQNGVSVQDIFDFLAFYFSNNPIADFNHSGSVSVQDIFDFMAAYFAGCPG